MKKFFNSPWIFVVSAIIGFLIVWFIQPYVKQKPNSHDSYIIIVLPI